MPLLALLVLAAQVGGSTPAPADATPSTGVRLPLCLGVQVAAPNAKVPSRHSTFSSRSILDLELRPRLSRDLPGDHLIQLKVFTPSGFLYQVITVPFAGTAPVPDPSSSFQPAGDGAADRQPRPPPTRVVEGLARPLVVQALVPVRGDPATRAQYELVARLPVAGTSITLGSLYGRWSVQPYLDNRPGPCAPATFFTISP